MAWKRLTQPNYNQEMEGSREEDRLENWACRRGRSVERGQICEHLGGRCGERHCSEGPRDRSSDFLCLGVFICKVGI